MKFLIAFGAILVVNGHNTCTRNSALIRSIEYQLKLVKETNRNCDCCHEKKEARIGFLAWNSVALENVTEGKDVIFDFIKTNQGKTYDPKTGIFTAPVEGLYSFSWTVTTQANKLFHTYLSLNGQVMARNHGGLDTINMSASQSAVVNMKKDDKVSIKASHGVGQYMFAGGWSAFSGFLVN